MSDKITLWEFIKPRWKIFKYRIKEMGINPNKEFEETTLNELGLLASELDVTIAELIEY